MKIEYFETYNELSCRAKDIIVSEVTNKPDLLLCAATGGSPTGTYQLLANEFQEKPELFSKLKIIKLDEWGGIPMNHPSTCEIYVQKHVIQPLKVSKDRYTGFFSNPENPEAECKRIQNFLEESGTIDVCILGLGMNGHVALNEPGEFLQPHCHVANLSEKTLKHQMVIGMNKNPEYGLTLGMADILQSKKILLLIQGSNKAEIARKLFSKQITTSVPASFLWLHQNVYCMIVKDVLEINPN